MAGILSSLGTLVGTVGGIIMLILIVKGAWDYVKGNGSPGAILVKFLVMLLFIGLIVVATNAPALMESFGGIATSAVDVVQEEASGVLGG